MKESEKILYYFRHSSCVGLLVGTCLLAGCSDDPDTEKDVPVGPDVEKTVVRLKAETGLKPDAAVGVFMLPRGGWLPEDVCPGADNLKYKLSDTSTGVLVAEDGNTLFWPESDKADFVAYAPYINAVAAEGYPISVVDQKKVSEENVLYARKTGVLVSEADEVKLSFEQALCKVTLNLKAGELLDADLVKEITPANVTFNRIPLNARLDLADGEVIPEKTTGVVHPLKAENADEGYDVTFSVVLIPQEKGRFLRRSISFSIEGRNYSVEIGDTVAWEAGMHYTYPMEVNDDHIVMGKTEFEPWDIRDGGTLKDMTEAWTPGMPYVPYPGMPLQSEGKRIYLIVCDADSHGEKIMEVLNNRGWAYSINTVDQKNLPQCFFPVHPDIDLYLTETYADPNPENAPCDILSASTSGFNLEGARKNFKIMMDKNKFPEFPLVITSAGNGTNMFTQEAWDFCLEYGTLEWDDIVRIKGWEIGEDGRWSDEQAAWYKPGDVSAAYIIQDVDGLGHAKDYIVVGRDDGRGNKPGPILKDRWICTYYSFRIFDVKTDGTSFSTPYVAKIAAEIKRRAPHYTNDEIAQLIFSTADDLGELGCDEVYGWGRMNPANIWEELTRRGY